MRSILTDKLLPAIAAPVMIGVLAFCPYRIGTPARAGSSAPSIGEILKLTEDFTVPEPGEDMPGGEATSRSRTLNANVFSHASGNLDFKKEFDFKIGNAIFRKQWVSSPASTKSSDGLGPLYNARACQNCHLKDGRGHPPYANWPEEDAVSFLLALSIPPQTEEQRQLLAEDRIKSVGDPVYGNQFQTLAIQGQKAEGKIHIEHTERTLELAGGEKVTLRAPHYRLEHLGYGPHHPELMISPRVAPQMIGLGLLETVPEEQILAWADPGDKDGDGISGKAQRVWSREHGRVMLGRFGLKAGASSILEQSAAAFAGDIGISSRFIPQDAGDCTEKQAHCLNAPNGSDPDKKQHEARDKLFDLVVFYAHNLAVPPRRDPGDPGILNGKRVFYQIGCVSCHRPKMMTGTSEDQPHLSGQLIWPYTDMLLHDMGDGLADNRPEGHATGREWRTSPLWGIGLTEMVSGHGLLLHDGRARNIKEAIMWHGGEAENARNAFAALAPEEREMLIAFLKSL